MSTARAVMGGSSLSTWIPIGAFVIAATVIFNRVGLAVAAYWIIGLALGIVLQRSRFCFAGAFRDLFLLRDGRLLRALLGGLLVATPGFWLLMARLVPDPSFGDLPRGAHVIPVGLHLVVGGILFGIGMVVAGGCVSGTLYRIGEGYVGSMVALGGILIGLSVAAHTWNWWWQAHIGAMSPLWLPRIVGYGGAVLLVMAALVGLYLLVLWWETRGGPGMPPMPARGAPPTVTFGAKIAAFQRQVFRQAWPYAIGGIALGVLNVFSFVFEHPLGVTGELSSWAERITGLVGWDAGPLLGVDQFAGCSLAVGQTDLLTAQFSLDGGLIVGSFAAAQASNEFRWRFPRQRSRYAQAIGGGVLMGYGAGIAVGCTIGAFFSSVPSLAVSGWVFGASLAVGALLGTIVIKRLP
ncbi:MAG: YeeE/YedE family protein [Chloroflexota bacterium]|nr:MAG: YeeE/YedE family protein [Chloroflexota bacterium]